MTPWIRAMTLAVAFMTATLTVPVWWCGLVAERIVGGDVQPLLALANTVARRAEAGDLDMRTGHARFDGEWRTGACAMTIVGLSEVSRRAPEAAERLQRGARACVAILDDPHTTAFVREAWGVDGGRELRHSGGHAWLGYQAVALGTYLRAFPDDAAVRDRAEAIGAALARRTVGRPVHRVETYPGETYPPDLAMVGAGMAMLQPDAPHARNFLDRWEAAAVEPETGLLRQALDPVTGAVRDGGRGSGTALAAWAVGLVDQERGARLWRAARAELWRGALGFGAVREVPLGQPARMDIDSGPVLMGLSVSASGFGLGAARVHDDPRAFVALHRTAWLFGAPAGLGDRRRWVVGGPLGDAILLAMEASPVGVPR